MLVEPSYLLAVLFVVLIAASLATVAISFARVLRGQELIAYEPRRGVPWGGAELLLLVLVFFTIQLAAGGAVWLAASLRALAQGSEVHLDDEVVIPDVDSLAGAALAVALSLVTFLIGVVLVRAVSRATTTDIGLTLARFPSDLGRGVLGFLAIAAPVYLIQLQLTQFFPSEHPLAKLWLEQQDPANMMLTIAVLFVAAVIVAPLAEEFLFRCLLQGWLENVALRYQLAATTEPAPAAALPTVAAPSEPPAGRASLEHAPASENPSESPQSDSLARPGASDQMPLPAPRLIGVYAAAPILVSSALFAAAHFSHGPDPVPLFLLAMVLGYLYQRTHRLWPSVIAHACLNATSLLMLLLQSNTSS
ncbi:MAG: CPBP family intramembrane metalloprotease [Pirellulales bacterium]|nr:CPBP family intramembrane metalloprotease [Pirellulales bacterium]